MEFLTERCYTALNADELKIGSKCIFANNLDSLKCKVKEGTEIRPIIQILNDTYERRFETDVIGEYPFAYLISEPEPNWIVYVGRCEGGPYLTACSSDRWEFAKKDYGAKTKVFEGSEDVCMEWYKSRKYLGDIIAAWEDGKTIQFFEHSTCNWVVAGKPLWSTDTQYRIKPELKWTDLKIGDIIREKDGTETRMVTVIDTSNEPDDEGDILHICLSDWWISDKELEDWEKVE